MNRISIKEFIESQPKEYANVPKSFDVDFKANEFIKEIAKENPVNDFSLDVEAIKNETIGKRIYSACNKSNDMVKAVGFASSNKINHFSEQLLMVTKGIILYGYNDNADSITETHLMFSYMVDPASSKKMLAVVTMVTRDTTSDKRPNNTHCFIHPFIVRKLKEKSFDMSRVFTSEFTDIKGMDVGGLLHKTNITYSKIPRSQSKAIASIGGVCELFNLGLFDCIKFVNVNKLLNTVI